MKKHKTAVIDEIIRWFDMIGTEISRDLNLLDMQQQQTASSSDRQLVVDTDNCERRAEPDHKSDQPAVSRMTVDDCQFCNGHQLQTAGYRPAATPGESPSKYDHNGNAFAVVHPSQHKMTQKATHAGVEPTAVDDLNRSWISADGTGGGTIADYSASLSSLEDRKSPKRRKAARSQHRSTAQKFSCSINNAGGGCLAMSTPRTTSPTATSRDGSRVIDMLLRITITEPVWNLGTVARASAIHALQNQPDGSFVVRSDRPSPGTSFTSGPVTRTTSSSTARLLHVRRGDEVLQYAVNVTSQGRWKLLDSTRTFESLPLLISHYCQPRSSLDDGRLQLRLPREIENARTFEDLQAIADRQAEFWVSILPTSTALLPPASVKHPTAIHPQLLRSKQMSLKRDDVNIDDPIFCDKTSDYEDLWQTPTPAEVAVAPVCVLDPAKYQLFRPLVTSNFTEVQSTRNSSFRPITAAAHKPPTSSAFGYEAKSVVRDHFVSEKTSSERLIYQRPSPIYAEPWDAVKTGSLMNSVESGVLVSQWQQQSTSYHEVEVSSEAHWHQRQQEFDYRDDDGETSETVASAGYRLPVDAVTFASNPPKAAIVSSARPPIQTLVLPPPPDSTPPLSGRRVVVPVVRVTSPANSMSRPESKDVATGNDARPPLPKGNCDGSKKAKFVELCGGDMTNGRLLSETSQSATVTDTELCTCEHPVLSLVPPGAVNNFTQLSVRTGRDYRSDYDNTSVCRDGNDEAETAGDNDDIDDVMQNFAPRSRLMTGSSMQTEYSPPWDGCRWERLMSFDGGGKGAVGEANGCTGNAKDRDDVTADNRTVTIMLGNSRSSSPHAVLLTSSNRTYCESSWRREGTGTFPSSVNSIPNDECHSGSPFQTMTSHVNCNGGLSEADRTYVSKPGSGTQSKKSRVAEVVSGQKGQNLVTARSPSRSSLADWMSLVRQSMTSLTTSQRQTTSPVTRKPSTSTAAPSTLQTPSSRYSTMSANDWPYRNGFNGTLRGGQTIWNHSSASQHSPDVIMCGKYAASRIINPRYRGRESPAAKISEFIVRLSKQKPEATFGALIQNFINCTKSGKDSNPRNVVSNIRQFMNGVKNFLTGGGEPELDKFIDAYRSKMKPSECLNLDAVIERALNKCTVKPLKDHIYQLYIYDYTRNGNLHALCDGLNVTRSLTPGRLGVPDDFLTSINQVGHYFDAMEKTYSPLKKLENLLSAMAEISSCISVHYQEVASSTTTTGQVSTDDLLSTVIVVLAERNVQAAEIEADYMWGLIHPSFLVGDARYHLTIFSSAVNQLKNMRQLVDSKSPLYRGIIDTNCAPPSNGTMDSFVSVITVDERCDTIVQHTLPVCPDLLAKDICCMLAHRLRITNPQDYGLYPMSAGSSGRRLSDDIKIHSMLLQPTTSSTSVGRQNSVTSSNSSGLSRRRVKFIYKRNDAHLLWPQSITAD